MQTYVTEFSDAFVCDDLVIRKSTSSYPLNERKAIACRAALSLDTTEKINN